jgi:hypothetical protein
MRLNHFTNKYLEDVRGAFAIATRGVLPGEEPIARSAVAGARAPSGAVGRAVSVLLRNFVVVRAEDAQANGAGGSILRRQTHARKRWVDDGRTV